MRSYPQSRLIRLDVYSVLIAWALLVMCAILFALGFFLDAAFGLSVEAVLIFTFSAFVLVVLLHVVLAFSHECPLCNKHPTMQGFAPIHSKAVPKAGVAGWVRVIWDVFRERRFTCIHCGEQFGVARAA